MNLGFHACSGWALRAIEFEPDDFLVRMSIGCDLPILKSGSRSWAVLTDCYDHGRALKACLRHILDQQVNSNAP